jgi:uncharacterized protein YbaP (TraB family)
MRIGDAISTLRSFRNAIVWFPLALLLTGCGSNTAPTPTPTLPTLATPPFYRIDGDGGATLLLMGTIHLGPSEGWQFSPALLRGLDRADRFVLELDLRKATEESVSTLLANSVVVRPPDTLMDLVGPETARLLEENDATLAAMGMPRNARKWKKPWYIALWILESASTRSGFEAGASAEDFILQTLGTRPLIGLETLEEQLGFFDDLSPHLQDMMLQDSLLRIDTAVEEIRSLVRAWRRGDEQAMEEMARDGVDELPDLKKFYEAVLTDRNLRWMTVFKSFLDDAEYAGETIFVGVGALHLVGDDGLVRLLRESGYDAEPIDHLAVEK